VRRSEIRNLSLRQNKISNLGTVSVALMIRDWMDVGPVGNNPFSNERSSQTDGQRDTGRPEEEELQTYNTDSIPPIISLQGQQLGRLVTLDLKGNDIRVRFQFQFFRLREAHYFHRREALTTSLKF
jgi:hypothetical protein